MSNKDKWKTIYLSTEAYTAFAELEVNFHGIPMTMNSDKLFALVHLYKETIKKK